MTSVALLHLLPYSFIAVWAPYVGFYIKFNEWSFNSTSSPKLTTDNYLIKSLSRKASVLSLRMYVLTWAPVLVMTQVPPFRHGIRLQSRPRVKFVMVPSNGGGVVCSVVVVLSVVIVVALAVVGEAVKSSECGYPVCGVVSSPSLPPLEVVVVSKSIFVAIVVCAIITTDSVIVGFVFSSAATVAVVSPSPLSVVVVPRSDSSIVTGSSEVAVLVVCSAGNNIVVNLSLSDPISPTPGVPSLVDHVDNGGVMVVTRWG